MHTKALSLLAVSTLAFATYPAQTSGADPNAPRASAEASDRQFLAALENRQPEPVAPVVTPAPAARKKEAPSPVKAAAAPARKAPAANVKREPARPKAATVEIRKALPVTTTSITTTTATLRSSIGLDEDADDRDDDDREHDHDEDNNRNDGFFDRLFRGEKIFR